MPDIFDGLDDEQQASSGAGKAPEPEPSPIPRFIRQGVDMSKVSTVQKSKPSGDDVIAEVNSWTPHTIRVSQPKLYDEGVANHELTHSFQFTRDSPKTGKTPNYQINPSSGIDYNRDYAYGGTVGLQDAQAGGKKLSDFTTEQQAEMVRDYGERQGSVLSLAKSGQLDAAKLKGYVNRYQAYHPYIEKLANLPGEKGGGYDINARPPAPGLPPADTPGLGVLQADPLMSGYSVPLPTPSQNQHAKSIAWPKRTTTKTR